VWPFAVSLRAGRRERGFALLVVLWAMVLLALLVTTITGTGRTEARLAANLRESARLQAAVDGAIYEVVFRALATTGAALPLGQMVRGPALVWVEDLSQKLNPNTASPQLVQALLRRVGVSDELAVSLTASIIDWRDNSSSTTAGGNKTAPYVAAGKAYGPPQEPFESVAELANVLGMTPDILARLAPHITVYGSSTLQSSTDPVVAAALADTGAGTGATAAATAGATTGVTTGGTSAQPSTGSRFLAITATVRGPGGARFTRRAEVSIGQGDHGREYRILTWTAS